MKKWTIALLLLTASAGGCASKYEMAQPTGLARSGLINDPAKVSRLEKSMTNTDIARLLDVDVRAKLPSAVAVARLASHCNGYQPYLAAIDAEELNGWQKTFSGEHLIEGVHGISAAMLGDAEKPSLHSLRVAAAKLNCELLLVYLQSDSYVDNYTDAAALYWTFIGLWTVPGNVYEHRTLMQAMLIDSRTGAILGTAAGDSRLKKTYAAAYAQITKDKLSTQAPVEAMVDLRKGCRDLVGRTVQAAVRAERDRSTAGAGG